MEKLKTLKDLHRSWFSHHEEDVNSVCGNMSINWLTDGRTLLDEEELHKEIIKWINELEKGTHPLFANFTKQDCEVCSNLLKYMFNLPYEKGDSLK